ncbi:hypothetical protein VP01_2990g2 [Puccinia sorghi]|uniref:Integrase catalytic domain-containing protein n=1 Tax=Puccinia sorghi TaxID=27349 RepID=A0A0L6V190_9BASI|nr:hypothetical protein VP01_2990g2 [Puccinia sorghi]
MGIDPPQDILAYLVLFKFPSSLQLLKRQIMHSDKDLKVEFVCNHSTQFNNESKAETRENPSSEAALYSGKNDKFNWSMRGKARTTQSKTQIIQVTRVGTCTQKRRRIGGERIKKNGSQTRKRTKSTTTCLINHGDPKSRIILDSGASAHIFNDKRYFTGLDLNDYDVIRTGKGNATLPIKGMDKQGCVVSTKNVLFKVSKDATKVLKGSITNGLYAVENPSAVGNMESSHFTTVPRTLEEIHKSFGNAAISRLERFIPNSVSQAKKRSFECKSCALAKITKQPFKGISTLASKPFERIHLDLIGPIDPQSQERHCYILSVVDNYTGYLAGFPLNNKDDTCDVLINLLENEKKRLGYFPTWVCSDGGGEFVNNRFVGFMASKNICRLILEPYHPKHNSRAKRANQTIVESMHATFHASRIKKSLWPELLKSCCLMLNLIPRKGEDKSPWQKMHGKILPPNYICALGTPAIVVKHC